MPRLCSLTLTLALTLSAAAADPSPPSGFTPIFNGKDLSGWHGWAIHSKGGSPADLAKLTPEERAKKVAEWTEDAKKHWRVENGELVNDGNGAYLATEKEYGDVELLIEYKTVAKADSGIYLRGHPQVQIWDTTKEGGKWDRQADKGSGGLFNNAKGAPGQVPLVHADRPFGEWNTFRIVQVGERTTVYLNDKLVVDHARMENYWTRPKPAPKAAPKTAAATTGVGGTTITDPAAKAAVDAVAKAAADAKAAVTAAKDAPAAKAPPAAKKPAPEPGAPFPLPKTGPILLQTHGGEIRWRNVYVREIPSAEANAVLAKHAASGFESVFNGRDFDGWTGALDNYEVVDGAIVCKPKKGGNLVTKAEYGDFAVRLEYKLPAGGNNGLAIRNPPGGHPSRDGMCEVQILDDTAAKYAKLDTRQFNGSVYGLVPAHRGYLRPVGEWNFLELTAEGHRLKVELNGTVILDADVSAVTEGKEKTLPPGKDRLTGHFGFAGHNDPVAFRNVQIKRLK